MANFVHHIQSRFVDKLILLGVSFNFCMIKSVTDSPDILTFQRVQISI
jgi:hypothetical protein